MTTPSRCTAAIALVALAAIARVAADAVPLKPVSAFSTIRDQRERSVALFLEAAKVITSPRCMNCHPATRQPTQGDDLHAHVPPMYGGPADHGVAGLQCASCHGATNARTLSPSIASIPGNSHWGLAPASMAWQGKSPSEICAQLKDGSRNGGRSLAKIHEHVTTDPLVGWAWQPGDGRTPAPGTQVQFGELIEAWIATGAQCPRR